MNNVNVNKIYITKEVADKLSLNPAYLIRLAKKLLKDGKITNNDMRSAGKRGYLFNENSVKVIALNLKHKNKNPSMNV